MFMVTYNAMTSEANATTFVTHLYCLQTAKNLVTESWMNIFRTGRKYKTF